MVTVDEQLGNRTLLKPPGIRLVNLGNISRLSIDRHLAWKAQHGPSSFSGFDEGTTILRHLFLSQPTQDSGGQRLFDEEILLQNQLFSSLPPQHLDAPPYELRKVFPGKGPHIRLDIREAFDRIGMAA